MMWENSRQELSTDLLPAPPVDVGDDVQQRFGQVAVAVEGVVPSTNGYVGEVPVRGQEGPDVITAEKQPDPRWARSRIEPEQSGSSLELQS